MFGSMGNEGGLLQSIMARMNPAGSGNPMPAPAVPNDGTMQPTIGPGMPPPAPPAAPGYRPKLGLPQGGILGMMQGQNPQGIMGLLQHLAGAGGGAPGAAPIAGAMPQAGMMPGAPPPAPAQPPQLPMNINPMDQF